MYVYLILLKLNTKLLPNITTWVDALVIRWDPHIRSCFPSVPGAKPQPYGSAGPPMPTKPTVLLFENCSIHWERGGGKENKSRHGRSSFFFFFFEGNDHNRKTKRALGQSSLLFPNDFPLLPQPSSLLLAPNKSLGGGLAVPPRAVF